MKVLITSALTKPPLVKAFENEGVEVVRQLDNDVKLIVPTVDEELPFFASANSYFARQGIQVMISSEDSIYLCRDKTEFYRFCRRHSFPAALTLQEDRIAKPRFGKGSKGIVRLDNTYILQNYIPWPEYSIDYFGNLSGKCISAIPRKRLSIVNGEAKAGEICLDNKLTDFAKNVGEDLFLVGHNTIQCFYDGTDIILNEVNCRFGGGFWITQPYFNSVKAILDLCN